MSVFLSAKCKRCRRAGVKLFLKAEKCYTAKCPLVRRRYPPGAHGFKSMHARMTPYGKQLAEKQKLKNMYGLRERQLIKYYYMARSMAGDVGQNFLTLLETRIDNIVYRLGIASSRSEARQIVGHGHMLLNNKKIDIPSVLLRPGDSITIRPHSAGKKPFEEVKSKIMKAELPSWLIWELGQLRADVVAHPQDEDLKSEVDIRSIIEYYSK